LALGVIALACSPVFAQARSLDSDAAPEATSPPTSSATSPEASSAAAAAPAASNPAPEDSLPRITVQIEPPPISISSSMIGVAGPLGAKAAEGKPIFAEFVTEHHQDFADGNSIARTTSSIIYRDAQGRIRRESQLSLPGLPAGVASATFITIVDRRLGCGWVLNPQEMVAHRYLLGGQPSYLARLNAQGGDHFLSHDAKSRAGHHMEPGGRESGNHHWRPHAFPPSVRLSQDTIASPAAMSAASAEAGAASPQQANGLGGDAASPQQAKVGLVGDPAQGAARPEEAGYAGPPSMRIDQPFLAAPNPVRTENLGEEMILGFRAHGKRVITTLPAGEIGNDRSIDIVSEQWFSPELELVMRSMHRDPWGGEFTTTVVRIRRGEQPAHLFTVPSKYKVLDAESEGVHHVIETQGSRGSGTAPW